MLYLYVCRGQSFEDDKLHGDEMDVNIKENIDNLLKLINTPIHDEDWKRNVDDSIHKFSGGITKFITMFKHNIKVNFKCHKLI